MYKLPHRIFFDVTSQLNVKEMERERVWGEEKVWKTSELNELKWRERDVAIVEMNERGSELKRNRERERMYTIREGEMEW